MVIFTRPGSDPVYVASSNIGVPREDLLHVRYERGDGLLARLEVGQVVEDGDMPPSSAAVVPLRRRSELIGFISLGPNPYFG